MTTINRRFFGALTLAAAMTSGAAFADGHATTHTVTIQGMAFSPAQLTINAGDTVVFVNADGAPHTATANDGSFDTPRLRRGDEASVTFANAGTFDYFCDVHRRMTAQIIVQ